MTRFFSSAAAPSGDDDSSNNNNTQAAAPQDAWRRTLPAWLFKESIVADSTYNRWLVAPAAIATHLSIGSVYAWSMFNEPLTRELGVVASAASDWALPSVVPIFSMSIVFLGLSAAVAGRWLEDVGPRLCGSLAALCWGGGFLVSAAGIHLHSLPMLYVGYGVLGGIGLGLGYVSPVSTLLRWFPDRRGMATGLAVAGFGGGAMIAAPVVRRLLAHFATPPE
jgi:MFS family permease